MIQVQPPYEPLYTTDKNIILITGGRGSAKSFNANTFLKRLTYESGHVALLCRYTLKSAERSVIPEFREKIILDDGTEEFFHITKSSAINLYSDSRVLFSGIRTSSGNQTASLKSIQGLTTFVVDEAEEWQSEEEYDTIRLSVRKKGVKNRIIIIMNPTNTDHWVYKKYIQDTHRTVEVDGIPVQISTHPNVLHIHTTYLDNLLNLSQEFITDVNEIRQQHTEILKELRRVREELIQLIRQGRAESTEYSNKKERHDHLEESLKKTKYAIKIIGRWADQKDGVIFTYKTGKFDESLPYCYGQDYGFNIDPTTLIRVAVDTKAKKIYVKEEYYAKKSLGTDDIYEVNKARVLNPRDLIIGDSQEGRLISDLKKKGLNIEECEKGPGSVKAGITAMQDYEIIVDPDSFNLITEFNNYIWNDKKAGIPIDDYNHGIDAIRYAFRKLSTKRKKVNYSASY